tara:strand:+ start:1549 stop:1722 length:174 start_codon:yes stop_codon:yes gene_type:complete
MTDLIIFLVFIIAMTLFTGMIQAIQIEKLKERVRCLKISDELSNKQSEEINLRGKDF